ncbi:dimethylamine monooxygenase subunit DmmA family protein [soil metagenome]
MSAPAPPDYTSVPDWARAPQVEAADPTGRVHTLLEVGADAVTAPVVADWQCELGDSGGLVHHHTCADADEAVAALHADLADARVGHRLLVAGSSEACLAVRAAGVRAGLSDDEMRFGVVSVGHRTVWCVHCSATTSHEVVPDDPDDPVVCSGCARSLLVYPHVSRRTGQYLGFMVDAEEQSA